VFLKVWGSVSGLTSGDRAGFGPLPFATGVASLMVAGGALGPSGLIGPGVATFTLTPPQHPVAHPSDTWALARSTSSAS